MSNEHLHPIFKPLLNSLMPTPMLKIKIGDTLNTKHGISVITGIEVVSPGQSDGGIEVDSIYESDKDRCVFDLANGHWAYGDEVTVIRSTPENSF